MASNYTRRIVLWINGAEVQASIKQVRAEMQKLTNQQANMVVGSKEYVAAGTEIKKLKSILSDHNASLKTTESTTSKLTNSFKALLPALSIAAVIGFFKNLGTRVFDVQSKFQTFVAVLKTALGSKGAALASMQMIQDFAANTPFSVEGLTASFIKLVNRGFKPTKEELTKLGDLASTSGKEFDQLVEAILDAETGEFERLKEFGIKAKVSGDQVTLSFKGVKTTVDNNAESLRAYILSLGEVKGVMGSMAEISTTLAGQTSNLGDAWTTFMKTLGDSNGGVFSSVITGLTNIVTAATVAATSIRQIKLNAEIANASDNVKESMHEIDVMTASLVRNGVSLANAKKQAYDLYMAERNNQLNNLTRDIATTDAQLKVYTKGIVGFGSQKHVNSLLDSKTEFESRKRMLSDEVEQVKNLKDTEIDYSKQVVNYTKLSTKELNQLIKKGDELAKTELEKRKTANEGLKDAFKELQKQISDLDTQINNAIASGNTPLVQKLTLEKRAAEKLLETYKAVKEAYANGWNMDQHDMGAIDKLVSLGANTVVSNKDDKNKKSPLQIRKTGHEAATPEEVQQNALDRMEAERTAAAEADKKLSDSINEEAWKAVNVLNETIFNVVKNRQQAEFDHKMSLLEKERQAELSNKNLTEDQKSAINDRYDKKLAALKTKQFKRDQNTAVSMALVNGALAIIKTFSEFGWPLGIPMAIGQGVATLAQIAVIESQKPPEFLEGGFTNTSSDNRRPAGIVHDNEYVVPADGLKNPRIRQLINTIEIARLKGSLPTVNPALAQTYSIGYNNGGFTNGTRFDNNSDAAKAIAENKELQLTMYAILHRLKQPIDITGKIKGDWSLFDLEKIQKKKSDIVSATEM